MYKKIIKLFLLILFFTTIVFLYVIIDKEIIYPLDYFKSEDTKIEEQRARLQLLKDTVKQSPQILQKTIYAIDGNRTTKSIDSKNILYAISNTETFLTVSTPYINPKEIPDTKYSSDKIRYVIDEILKSPSSHLRQNIDEANDIKNMLWFGDIKISKLNNAQKLVFVTVKRSMLDKALKDPIYRKEFQHYMWNLLNHEVVHMLGGDEYFAAKYGQTSDINASSEFFQDLTSENFILELINKYFDDYYDYFSKKMDYILNIDIKKNNPQKNKILSMIDTITSNKKSIIIFSNRQQKLQLRTKQRALWVVDHNQSVINEYYLILTRGETFLTDNIASLNTIYSPYKSAGIYLNIYKLLKEKGYSKKDMELLNIQIAERVLDIEYGFESNNSIPYVIKCAKNSLNKLVSICFEDKTVVDDNLANGILYFYGSLVGKDYKKAKKYLELAVKKDSLRAKSLLARIYSNGLGTKKDLKRALELYEDIHDYNAIGWIYYTGDKSIKDYKKAFDSFYYAAINSNAFASSNVGLMYVRGEHVKVDYKIAMKYFEKAIKNNEVADILNNIAWMHLNGLGVKQDTEKALELFKKAAKGYSTAAIINLEWIYSTNEFGLKNSKKENYWHKKVKDLKQKNIDENYELTYITDQYS